MYIRSNITKSTRMYIRSCITKNTRTYIRSCITKKYTYVHSILLNLFTKTVHPRRYHLHVLLELQQFTECPRERIAKSNGDIRTDRLRGSLIFEDRLLQGTGLNTLDTTERLYHPHRLPRSVAKTPQRPVNTRFGTRP